MVNTSHTAARSTSDPARVNKVSVGGRAAAAAKVPLQLWAATGRREATRSTGPERKPQAGRRAATPAWADDHQANRLPCRPRTGPGTKPASGPVGAPRPFTCCLAAAAARSPAWGESRAVTLFAPAAAAARRSRPRPLR